MWGHDVEEDIRQVLAVTDPAYVTACQGYFYNRAYPTSFGMLPMREALAYLDRFCTDKRSLRILDYGCGCGQFLLYLWRYGYSRLEGWDANARWLVAARAVFAQLAPSAPVAFKQVPRAAIYKIPSGFDVITMLGLVYGHKIRVQDVYASVFAALPPGGAFFVNDGKRPRTQSEACLRAAGFQKILTVAREGHNQNYFYIGRKAGCCNALDTSS